MVVIVTPYCYTVVVIVIPWSLLLYRGRYCYTVVVFVVPWSLLLYRGRNCCTVNNIALHEVLVAANMCTMYSETNIE